MSPCTKRLTFILVGNSSTLDYIHQGGSVAMDLDLQGNRAVVQSLPQANKAALDFDQQDNSGNLHSAPYGDRATLQPVQSQPVDEGTHNLTIVLLDKVTSMTSAMSRTKWQLGSYSIPSE